MGRLLPSHLPVDDIRDRFESSLDAGSLVLSAPTGSGKSTRVPSWCGARGRVVVVEPRRVACRALASALATDEGSRLGDRIGYLVRDDARAGSHTQVVFATPGVVLRQLADDALDAHTLVLDEFHERTLDLDLLAALARHRGLRVVVMSATLDGGRIATWLGGPHLSAAGRTFPVDVHHLGGPPIPDVRGLEDRVVAGVRGALEHPGDVLVFLPGKGEIAACERRLRGTVDADLVPMHGGLSLKQQSRALADGDRRRVVLATNVAETSLTVPGIRTVVDTGLVRRTRYHEGRGYLTLAPVALDSADQRAGRAGRTAPGRCLRLWRDDRQLDAITPPEIRRQSLVSLVLAAASCGTPVRSLPFLDPPEDYAIDDAEAELGHLGALDARGRLTDRGRQLFGLPVDAHLGRLLVEARAEGGLADAIDLVAALSTPRRLFVRRVEPEDDLGGEARCDVTAQVRAIREGDPDRHGLDPGALRLARSTAKRLRAAFGVARTPAPPDRRQLARLALAAWPRAAMIPRRRKRKVAWSPGGEEFRLGREVRLDEEEAEALIAFDHRALGSGRHRDLLITVAMPVPRRWLVEAGKGRDHVTGARVEDGVVVADVARVYAGHTLATDTRVPEGPAAVEALAEVIGRGSVLKGAADAAAAVHRDWCLAHRIGEVDAPAVDPEQSFEAWLRHRLTALGVATGEDLALLVADDLLPDPLPIRIAERLERDFPASLSIAGAAFDVSYDVARRTVVLDRKGRGNKAPNPTLLPKWNRWRVVMRQGGALRELRPRRR